jgi:hypothetical protein
MPLLSLSVYFARRAIAVLGLSVHVRPPLLDLIRALTAPARPARYSRIVVPLTRRTGSENVTTQFAPRVVRRPGVRLLMVGRRLST